MWLGRVGLFRIEGERVSERESESEREGGRYRENGATVNLDGACRSSLGLHKYAQRFVSDERHTHKLY